MLKALRFMVYWFCENINNINKVVPTCFRRDSAFATLRPSICDPSSFKPLPALRAQFGRFLLRYPQVTE